MSRPLPVIDDDTIWGFFAQLAIRATGCWEWKSTFGYGQYAGMFAHRFAWMLAHGRPPPRGADVLHWCENARCVSPWHLRLGDAAENARDSSRNKPQGFIFFGPGTQNDMSSEDEERIGAILGALWIAAGYPRTSDADAWQRFDQGPRCEVEGCGKPGFSFGHDSLFLCRRCLKKHDPKLLRRAWQVRREFRRQMQEAA